MGVIYFENPASVKLLWNKDLKWKYMASDSGVDKKQGAEEREKYGREQG